MTSVVTVFAVVSLLDDGLSAISQVDLLHAIVVGGAVGVRLQPEGVRAFLLVAPDVDHAAVDVEREHQRATGGAALRRVFRRISGFLNG